MGQLAYRLASVIGGSKVEWNLLRVLNAFDIPVSCLAAFKPVVAVRAHPWGAFGKLQRRCRLFQKSKSA